MQDPYQGLQAVLHRWGADPDAAELHGQVTGWLCGGGQPESGSWVSRLVLDEQFGDAPAAEVERILAALASASWHALEDTDLGFQPLLPDDDSPLDERVAALLQWAQGFLAGLGLSGFSIQDSADGVTEYLSDLGTIAGSAVDELEADEEGEMALVELIEFLRMGTLLVHLSARRSAA
jgi:uncharacterized protein